MAENCNNDCNSCDKNCSERKMNKKDFLVSPNKRSNVKKVIGIMSGKGGVGKSFVTSMLAVALNKKGYKTAILDADITGPSIPKAFSISEFPMGTAEDELLPASSKSGVQIMSINFLLEDDTTPVIWRGPVIAGTVKQFWSEVVWEDVDYMFVDMPPGTGDVPLTVFQSLPLDGVIVVSSPQQLVGMIVEKAIKMAEKMDIKVIGLVENMSYVECPDCGRKINIYGKSHIDEIANKYNLDVLAKLPIKQGFASACDGGFVENLDISDFSKVVEKLVELL